MPIELGPNVSLERARLLLRSTKRWVNGTTLHYYFFDDAVLGTDEAEKDIVRQAFEAWADLKIGLRFDNVSSVDDAEIRIGFLRGDGYWSYIGRDILSIGQGERTMNFGQDLRMDSRGVDVPIHEIGHTLGFPHEHQNPFAGIVWDRQAVIDYFSGPPNNWDLADIEHNVLNKLPAGQFEGSDWDPNSVMHYSFDPGLIREPQEYHDNGLTPDPGLSSTDIEQILKFSPQIGTSYPELRPFEFTRLSLSPGDQADFSITPTATRTYTIQTFGTIDSVMVLFEDNNGEFQYVAGDDDGGWDRNARLILRLYAGRKYALRIRLYYEWASGDTAVMLW